jgi:hypothetical protein
MLKHFALAGLAALGLTACVTDDGYGYGSVGYASGYYGDGGADYAYAGPAGFGWYGDYYYPGAGVYVYDRNRRPYRWNGDQQRYWQSRAYAYPGGRREYREDRREVRENWQAFRQDRRADDRAYRQDRRQDRQAFRGGQLTREQYRTERREDQRAYTREQRQDRRALRRENRRDIRD